MKLRTILILVVLGVVSCAGLIGYSFYLAVAPDTETLGGEFHESMQSVAFSPDGTTLVAGNALGQVRVWDTATGKERGKALQPHNRQNVSSLSFSPDGRMLASAGDDGKVVFSDMLAGVTFLEIPGEELLPRKPGKGEAMAGPAVKAVAFSPDGKTLAFGGRGLVLWNPAARKVRFSVEKSGPVRCLKFTPDGERLATGGDRGIVLWDVETGQEAAVVYERGKGPTPQDLAFSPDGKTIAWAGDDHDVYLWDVEGRKETAKLSGHTDRVVAVAFHPEGKLLASGDRGEQVFLWDVPTQSQVTFRRQSFKALMGEPGGPVTALVFSPDGKRLASAGGPIVKFWEVARLAR